MRSVAALTIVGVMTALLMAACASGGSNAWVDLKTDASTGPTIELAGTVHHLEVEGGVWVIRDAKGTGYQPTNLPDRFRKEGMRVEAVGRRRDNLVSIGMTGTLVELSRIRESTAQQGQKAVVSGTVGYRERMALPPTAVVQVQLVDVSKQDVASTTIAETSIEAAGKQVPIPFELAYNPAAIDANRTYAVRATIREGTALLFTTTSSHQVITRGNPTRVDLMLQRVTGSAPGAATDLRGTAWVLEDLAGAGVVDRVQATLEFAQDGTVSGNSSCNQLRGPVTVKANEISFGDLAVTRKACAEAVMQQEQRYLDALRAAKRFEIKGSLLFLHVDRPQPLRFVARER
jgi:putative lipoprotein